jgi:phage terminase large subunit-like protein
MDPVTAYARSVIDGQVVASRLVRQACDRHVADLTRADLVWRPEKAQLAIEFFAEVLFLPERTDADDRVQVNPPSAAPEPFILSPWQAFIVGSLFGWYTPQGFRRFREAYIETAKGSGKTPLGAGIMLYLLVADGQRGAQVFLAAVTREQSGIAWRDCRAMVEASPDLIALFGEDGFRANELIVPGDRSYLKPISSEKRALDGKRVHGALVDELHEHATQIVVNKMRAGTKGMRNALIVKTTNSGFDRMSVCWHHHEYSRKVLDGTVPNDAWFAFVCGLDPCEDCLSDGKWFPSEDCPKCDDWKTEGPHWLKANPNLGKSLPWQYVRERVEQAKGMPTEVSDVLRFNFCVWTAGYSRSFDMGRWAACKPFPSEEELVAAPCFGGFDLGETDDFSAWAVGWCLPDGRLAVRLQYWLPQSALEKYPNRPYDHLRRSGPLTITAGDVTDYAQVRAAILSDWQRYGIRVIGFDMRAARETSQILQGFGVTLVEIPQGQLLHEALKRLLGMVKAGDLCHGNEVILSWMASNAVIDHGSGANPRMQLNKMKSADKIDGISAIANLIEVALIRRLHQSEPTVLIVGR